MNVKGVQNCISVVKKMTNLVVSYFVQTYTQGCMQNLGPGKNKLFHKLGGNGMRVSKQFIVTSQSLGNPGEMSPCHPLYAALIPLQG